MLYVRKAGVVGAGTMGAAIAELFAYNEIPVVLKDVREDLVARGLERVRGFTEELLRFQEGRFGKERERL